MPRIDEEKYQTKGKLYVLSRKLAVDRHELDRQRLIMVAAQRA